MPDNKAAATVRNWKLYHSVIKEQQIVLSNGVAIPFVNGRFATNDPKVQAVLDKEIEDYPTCFIKPDEYEYEIDSPLDIASQKERMQLLELLRDMGGVVTFPEGSIEGAAAALNVTTTALLQATKQVADSNSGATVTGTNTGTSAARAALEAGKA